MEWDWGASEIQKSAPPHPTIISGISSELNRASSCWSAFGPLTVIALAELV
jgi:hypothetical protein